MSIVRSLASASLWIVTTATPLAAGVPFFPPYGIDLTAQDRSVRPGDDFYQYENGAWLARTPIPPDQAQISTGREGAIRVEARLRQLIEDAAQNVPVQPIDTDGKVGAMYAAFMNEARIEALGMQPIKAQLDAVTQAADKIAIAGLMARASYDFGIAPFELGIDVDLKAPSRYAVYIGQSGVGLPDRDYYLKPEFADQRAAYKAYIRQLLALIGWKDEAAGADAVLDLETKIAEVSWTKAAQRDLPTMYNPVTRTELEALAPGFPWATFLTSAGLGSKTRLVLTEKSAIPKIAAIYADVPLATLKAELAFSIADHAAPYLSAPFQNAHFAFRDHALSGQPAMAVRWKRAVRAVSGGDCGADDGVCFGTLDWAVGELYVRHDFRPEAKAKAERLVQNLLRAYHDRIAKLDWMGPATKQEALKKLDTYTIKVG